MKLCSYDIQEERTDVTCVESNDNKEYERAQGSYSDRIKISEKVEKIINKMKYNRYNKQTECDRIPTQIPKVTIVHKEVHTRDKEFTDVTYVENK